MDSYKNNLHKMASPKLFEFAKTLRQSSTEAEKLVWQRIRNKQVDDLKFRRQHPLDEYIADFYCHEKKLVIELDGSIHDNVEKMEDDFNRTFILKEFGITVLRFRNEEIKNEIEFVIEEIKKIAENFECNVLKRDIEKICCGLEKFIIISPASFSSRRRIEDEVK